MLLSAEHVAMSHVVDEPDPELLVSLTHTVCERLLQKLFDLEIMLVLYPSWQLPHCSSFVPVPLPTPWQVYKNVLHGVSLLITPPAAFAQPPVFVVLPFIVQAAADRASFGMVTIIANAIIDILIIFNFLFCFTKNRQHIDGREVEKSYYEMTLGFRTGVLFYNHRPPTKKAGTVTVRKTRIVHFGSDAYTASS